MRKENKSIGIILAGIYLLVIAYAVFEYLSTPPGIMKEFALLILTAPFSFVLLLVLSAIGLMDGNDAMVFPIMAFGAIINTWILFFIGTLLSRLLSRFDKK